MMMTTDCTCPRYQWRQAWRWARGERLGFADALRFAALDALKSRRAADPLEVARWRRNDRLCA